jgi:hypothetical protein
MDPAQESVALGIRQHAEVKVDQERNVATASISCQPGNAAGDGVGAAAGSVGSWIEVRSE